MTAQPQRTSQALPFLLWSWALPPSSPASGQTLWRWIVTEHKRKEENLFSLPSFWTITGSSFFCFFHCPYPSPPGKSRFGWRQYFSSGLVTEFKATPCWWPCLRPPCLLSFQQNVVSRATLRDCLKNSVLMCAWCLVYTKCLINREMSFPGPDAKLNGPPFKSKLNRISYCPADFTRRKWDLHR